EGVSFELARALKLKNIKFLENQESSQFKVVVFVPNDKADEIAAALFNAGAGKIGEYDMCSFRLSGEGTFQGSVNTNPAVGKKEQFETLSEVRVEVIVDSWNLNKAINAMLKAHPYEEPAFDVYPLKNKNINYGAGAIGELSSEMSEKNFLLHLCKSLKINNFKYCSGKNKMIKKAAVCGGSGADMLNSAISLGADAFITADIKYHTYQEAKEKILFIDAGHYETEIFSLNAVERKINKFLKEELEDHIQVFKYTGTTSPVKFYKQ
ncbi:MAG: Nif3-like dinuclear metal center hexameric protein, partial [Bacteroidota bacterium]